MMRSRSFIWRYFPLYLVIILASIGAISWYTSATMKEVYLDRIAVGLEARSRLLADRIAPQGRPLKPADIQAACRHLGTAIENRFTVILPSGQVIGDSEEDPAVMENHANRPEIVTALESGMGQATRYSRTLKSDLLYVAVRQPLADGTALVVRASLPVSGLTRTVHGLYRRITWTALFIVLGSIIVSLLISRQIRKPVHLLTQGATRFGQGEMDHRVHISDPEEFMMLGNAMNRMATEISRRMATITEQRNELESVLSSMKEGVLVVDKGEHILRFNKAAAGYFVVPADQAVGRPVQEVIRNVDLLSFIRQTLNSSTPLEREIVLRQAQDRHLQAHGTSLMDAQGGRVGVVVVLSDVSRLKKLETLRKEFVANVSHELKTPITAIKGSVETLRDGAVDKPEDARQFIDIILKHADRLNTLVEDLLNLSRIEREVENNKPIEKSRQPLLPLIQDAVALCRALADDKGIALIIEAPEPLTAEVNGDRVQQALINLVDNAIKYSPQGRTSAFTPRRWRRAPRSP